MTKRCSIWAVPMNRDRWSNLGCTCKMDPRGRAGEAEKAGSCSRLRVGGLLV